MVAAPVHPRAAGLILDSENTAPLEGFFVGLLPSLILRLLRGVVGNVHYQIGEVRLLRIRFGKVKSDARPDQLIAFT
jgi:hypothetical protein